MAAVTHDLQMLNIPNYKNDNLAHTKKQNRMKSICNNFNALRPTCIVRHVPGCLNLKPVLVLLRKLKIIQALKKSNGKKSS